MAEEEGMEVTPAEHTDGGPDAQFTVPEADVSFTVIHSPPTSILQH
jgi:hypothetical protein